ncbi:peptide transporter family 1 isoform X1 [Planococcus citri]|uniref:peptide transporter family 1 isoform X1 n=2 Tax=Planococcus citri TaxID=170843 RepID=UPI0031F9DE9D
MKMEDQKKALPYPKSVFFIISNEFCERFSYYGMKTVLSLYLTTTLHYNENEATILYHTFAMLCYFFPLFGAIIADSFFGKFNTIFYLSIVYAIGNIVLSFASTAFQTIPYKELSLLGLLLISIGTGGIKPCVSSFGGDQFVLPDQSLQLQRFFSIFYFSINAGSLISTFFTPILRNNVKCFGQDSCFPLAFGTPAILMIVSVVIFVCGRRLYVIKKPKENVITIFFNCIARALKNKFFHGSQVEKKSYWLEYADDRFSHQQISDIKAVLKVLYLFIPVPFFWALFDQQGSRWTFQATNMDGRLFGYYIKPDQMQVMNPLLILLFIPIFELYVYPLLTRIRIKRPLQKLTLGGFMAAASFVISAYVEHYVEQSYVALPSAGQGHVRLFNSLNCAVHLNPPINNVDRIEALSMAEFLHLSANESERITSISADQPCNLKSAEVHFTVYDEKTKSYFINQKSDKELALYAPAGYDNLKKDEDGNAKIRSFYNSENLSPITLTFSAGDKQISTVINPKSYSEYVSLESEVYNVLVNGTVVLENISINPAEIDVLLLNYNGTKVVGNIVNIVPPNEVHMLWQLPQIIIITAAEIMFSITGLEFSFTQAPESMKSVLSSAWLLTVAFGNLFVVVISEIEIFKSQVYEFLLFAGLMVLDMLLFVWFSLKYQYTDYSNSNKKDDDRVTASMPTLASDLSS